MQCLASQAKQRGIKCAVIIPDYTDAYRQKLLSDAGVENLVVLSFFDWWDCVEQMAIPEHIITKHPELKGMHYVCQTSTECVAGDATVVNEILDEMPDVDTIVVPYGFGSFSCGSGIVLKDRSPKTRLVAVEASTSTPYRNALNAGKPSRCSHTPSFVSQLGGPTAIPSLWDEAKKKNDLINDSAVVSLDDVAEAIRLLKRNHDIVAEGAGAAPLAAALSGQAGKGKIVCVLTGGNMESSMLSQIMQGSTPEPGMPIPPLVPEFNPIPGLSS
ncbi:MAG: PLP-dependent lyase/thiolase [Verrucomicrobiota bacterium]